MATATNVVKCGSRNLQLKIQSARHTKYNARAKSASASRAHLNVDLLDSRLHLVEARHQVLHIVQSWEAKHCAHLRNQATQALRHAQQLAKPGLECLR